MTPLNREGAKQERWQIKAKQRYDGDDGARCYREPTTESGRNAMNRLSKSLVVRGTLHAVHREVFSKRMLPWALARHGIVEKRLLLTPARCQLCGH